MFKKLFSLPVWRAKGAAPASAAPEVPVETVETEDGDVQVAKDEVVISGTALFIRVSGKDLAQEISRSALRFSSQAAADMREAESLQRDLAEHHGTLADAKVHIERLRKRASKLAAQSERMAFVARSVDTSKTYVLQQQYLDSMGCFLPIPGLKDDEGDY